MSASVNPSVISAAVNAARAMPSARGAAMADPPPSLVMPAMSPAPSLDASTGLVVLTFSAAFGRPETTLPTPRELSAYRLGLASPDPV